MILCFHSVLAIAGLAWAALRGQPNAFLYRPPLGHGTPFGSAQLASSLAIGTALGLLVVLATRLLEERFAWARVLHNEFHHVLGSLTRREIVLLAAASSLGEEIFFRGALLPQLAMLAPGTSTVLAGLCGVLGSSLIFALLHIGPGTRFLPWTLLSLGVGVLLGGSFVVLGDLFAPIAIHFTVNLLNLQEIVRRPALA